jgi:hypothetical protein
MVDKHITHKLHPQHLFKDLLLQYYRQILKCIANWPVDYDIVSEAMQWQLI